MKTKFCSERLTIQVALVALLVSMLMPQFESASAETMSLAISGFQDTQLLEDELLLNLLANLGSSDPAIRLNAAYQLGKMGPKAKKAVSRLKAVALADEETDVRVVAIYALGKIGENTQDIVNSLITLLHDEHENIRYVAVRVLGKLGTDAIEAVPALLETVKTNDVNGDTKAAALEALIQIGLPTELDTINLLINLLQDPNWYVRQQATIALASIETEAVPILISELTTFSDYDRASAIVDVLSVMSDESIVPLADVLKNSSHSDQILAFSAVALTLMGENAEVSVNEAAANLVAPAVSALGYFGDRSIPTLIAALGNDEPQRAVEALAKHNPGAIPYLLHELRENQTVPQSSLVDALSRFDIQVVPRLITLLDTSDNGVCLRAIETLKAIGVAAYAAVPYLIEALNKETCENAQPTIIDTLGQIAHSPTDVVPVLLTIANDQQATPNLRQSAIASLTEFGPAASDAIPGLVALVENTTDPEIQIAGVVALSATAPSSPTVISLLSSIAQDANEVEDLRVVAIAQLGRMGTAARQATSDLSTALGDPNSPKVQKWAAWSLGQIKPNTDLSVSALIARLADSDGANGQVNAECLPPVNDAECTVQEISIWALGQIGSVAVPELLQILQNPDNAVDLRVASAKALGQIGAAAVPGLVDSLSTIDEVIAPHVKDALATIDFEAMPELIVRLRSAETSTKKDIVEVLSLIGPRAFTGFEIAIQDTDGEIRDLAVSLIDEFFQEWRFSGGQVVKKGFAVAETVPFLITVLQDPDIELRREAIETLGLIGPEARSAVPALSAALWDDNLRCDVALALLLIGPDAAQSAHSITGLLNIINKKEHATICIVNDDYRKIMAASPYAGSLMRLATYSKQNRNNVELSRILIDLLSMFGADAEVALPELKSALSDDVLRRSAAETLGNIGFTAVPTLIEVIKNPFEGDAPGLIEALQGKGNDVRRSAAYALLRIGGLQGPMITELYEVMQDTGEEIFLRSMIATVLEKNDRDTHDFWSIYDITNPSEMSCPYWTGMRLDGNQLFDIYNDECRYGPTAQAPGIRRFFRRLVAIFRG